MRLFWRNGFEAVSIQDLLDELKITNSSFYHAFESKEALFDEVLKFYYQKIGAMRIAPLLEDSSPTLCLRNYFDRLIELNLNPKSPGGCLIANSAQLLDNQAPKISRKLSKTVQASLDRMENALYELLKRGKEEKEFRANLDARSTARLFVSIVYGLNVIARTFHDRKQLEDVAQAAIQLVR
jgi:TetR/AcrR family transcriptional repressor of nem operon